ncbi:PhzF family phenazine biosynthesis protein [Paraflavitalea sp. CAU 1676]|uniref:PhzF family phenazine biosynthesis protein n=1 Tax=Paraflavitalea sp. CAU 1676 TaxID=3032598 RepID=UPI0023D99787|nr:PhzF family phenazine biosynthesis protein [Paraflavitalea sp. CAU 1676]MDF2192845.1 PhzF family phenazine biosynthesis protein [Paraflavitalea sp. CAU 1676]
MEIQVHLIDTFTSEAFRGNPTAVCFLPGYISLKQQQAIASELNLPVTAFTGAVSSHGWGISYFTPATQIPTCGHATLAAARMLFDEVMDPGVSTLNFLAGRALYIPVRKQDDLIVMTYPRYDLKPVEPGIDLLNSLGITQLVSAGMCSELETLFIELDSAAELKKIQPDYLALVASNPDIKEVVITSASNLPDYDYLLRSFCPWIGIDEDPVTGSVHSVLAGFWQQRLDKNNLKAWQCSPRGGELFVSAFDDKVELGGTTVTLMRGTMNLPD